MPTNEIKPIGGMFGRLARGGAWLGAGTLAENAIRFGRNMLLARLLAPEAFGVMAIILSVCSLFQVLTGLGVKEATVQSPRGTERTFLNGAWWLSLARGLVLYLAASFVSPWIAKFYEAPELTLLLRIAFLNVLAASCLSAGAFVAIKRMEYKKWVLIQQGGSIIGITTTIALACWLKGVLALVIGYAVEGVVRTLISYIVCPFKPGFQFNKADFRAVLSFASGMFGLPILMLIYTEGAVFTVGKLCSKQELGVFAMVLTLARIPTMFSGQLVDLLMPAFSEVQTNMRRINYGILKVTTLVVCFGLPAASFMAVYGKQVLMLAFGSRYAGGSAALSLLFMNELLLVCSVPIATVYLAVGKPSVLRRFSLARAVLISISIVPLIHLFGITGAALAPLVAMAGAFWLQLTSLRAITNICITSYIYVWLRGALIAIPWALFFVVSYAWFGVLKPAASLAGVALGGIALAGFVSVMFTRHLRIRQFLWPFSGAHR